MKVAHIEDNKVIRRLVCEALKETEFDYIGFRTAEEALDTIRGGVDVLLLDLKLTGKMQGRDLLDLLEKEGVKVKVIPLTAAPGETKGDLRKDYPELVVETLFKPFEPDELLKIMQRALE
ncbi:response regulator [archaeon]|nr:response regulator [archaeon]